MTKTIWLSGLAALLAACGFDAAGEGAGDDGTLPPPTTDSIALARTRLDDGVHLVLVTADDGNAIDGTDLGLLEGSAMDRIAATGIEGILADAATAPPVHLGYEALLPPVDAAAASVATAANYPDPTNITDEPFLFPTFARPAPALGSVPASAGELFDYEVQLCVVLGRDSATVAAFAAAPKGFFLCDYIIDRSAQLDGMDFDHPERADGYAEAFTRHGSWRTGPYLYVPRNAAAYLEAAQLHLAVNGTVRQDGAVSAMEWPIDEIAKQTLAVGPDQRWTFDELPVGVLTTRSLPAGLVFLTGTPSGVAFEPPSEDFLGAARHDYIFNGGYLTGMSLDAFTKTKYRQQEQEDERYLHAGDRVEASGTYLGTLRVTID